MAPYFQTLNQFGWADWYGRRPRVADWYERVRDRASYQSAVSADFSADKLADLNARGEPAWAKITELLAA